MKPPSFLNFEAGNYWDITSADDYAEAFAAGIDMASQFIEWVRASATPKGGMLGLCLSDAQKIKAGTPAGGYLSGFMHELARRAAQA